MNKSITFLLFGENRTIDYPNVGQLLEIESKKMMLSNGTYSELNKTNTTSSKYILDLVDAMAHFTVLIPKLSKNLQVDTVYDLGGIESKEVVKAYNEHFRPWYDPFAEELYKDMDIEPKGKESKPDGAEGDEKEEESDKVE